MKNIFIKLVLMITAMSISLSVCAGTDEGLIKEVIVTAYMEGMQIEPDVDKVQNGFHSSFFMYVYENGGVVPVSQKNLLEIIAGKEDATDEITYSFESVDVVGNSAVAKLIVYKDGELTFTDFFSLYKLDDGWKIVAKIYETH